MQGRAGVGAAKAAGVRELEADAEVGGVAEAFAVAVDEGLAQGGDGGQRGFVEQELVGGWRGHRGGRRRPRRPR